MIELKYGFLCSSAIVDSNTGQLSIINLIDQINVEELPGMFNSASFVLFWERKDESVEEISFKVRIRREPELPVDMAGMTQPEFDLAIPANTTEARSVIILKGIFMSELGVNKFIFEIYQKNEWIIAGDVKVKINKLPDPSMVAKSPATPEVKSTKKSILDTES